MSITFQTICFFLCFGIISTWPFIFGRSIPVAYVHASIKEDSGSSVFNDVNQMMENIHGYFDQVFNWPKVSIDYQNHDYETDDDSDEVKLPSSDVSESANKQNQKELVEDDSDQVKLPLSVVNERDHIQKQLDAIQPVCTTITDSPTTISPRKSRRRKPAVTQTTTCVKELVHNGRKYYLEDVKTTDDKGVVVKNSQTAGSVLLETNSSQTKVLV